MSDLPTIDPLKVAQRNAQKLRVSLAESEDRETQLEILAEALRDERDAFSTQLDEALERLAKAEPEVADITSLPAK